jgi:hypothetical protein
MSSWINWSNIHLHWFANPNPNLLPTNQPKQLGENLPMVGHFPTNMNMGTFVSIENITQHKLIPKINLT